MNSNKNFRFTKENIGDEIHSCFGSSAERWLIKNITSDNWLHLEGISGCENYTPVDITGDGDMGHVFPTKTFERDIQNDFYKIVHNKSRKLKELIDEL